MKKLLILIFIAGSFFPSLSFSDNLTPLAARPDWSSLHRYDNTITAEQLRNLLQTVYVPDASWKSWITIKPTEAVIQPYSRAATSKNIILSLAASSSAEQPIPRYWKTKSEHAPAADKPLTGLKIAIDPGHLGGSWAKMEERWFQIGHSRPVEEGTMTLIVAKLLAEKLRAMGATVVMTRNHNGPTTPLRPYMLKKAAKMEIAEEGKKCTRGRLKRMQELFFYRVAEIHHRANRVNHDFKPDLVICLHFNAEDWNDPKHPTLTDKNHLHLLIEGVLSRVELEDEDVRYAMLCKLLGRVHQEEVGISNDVAHSLAAATGLPPFVYHNAAKAQSALAANPYLWNRNLLATRLYQCPTIYCEAYVMNNADVFKRVQAGDYKGVRAVNGKTRPSIYHEYANAVAQGVENYFIKKLVTTQHSN